MTAVELDPAVVLRIRDADDGGVNLAKRCGITPRTAGDLLRAMHAEGVIGKRGRFFFGRLSRVDAWLCCEGAQQKRSRAGAR